jgi:hypothetical protein
MTAQIADWFIFNKEDCSLIGKMNGQILERFHSGDLKKSIEDAFSLDMDLE